MRRANEKRLDSHIIENIYGSVAKNLAILQNQ
jgi:hypothetical protein